MDEEKRNSEFTRRSSSDDGLEPSNIKKLLDDVEEKLKDSIHRESLEGLNSFERKLVHRHFDHSGNFETRTYRNGEKFTLCVYPVGNLKKFAGEKAGEMLESGKETEDLPAMGSYERYIVHAALQNVDGVETSSQGEGPERHIQIVSKKFGRRLRKIVKKIKLF